MFNKANTTKLSRALAMLLAAAAIVCASIFTLSCGGAEETTSADTLPSPVTFSLVIVKADGSEKTLSVTTDKTTLAAALIDKGIITGIDGPYGLMIQSVDGERHVWEEDGKYWAIYIGDDYATTGADGITPEANKVYKLKAE